MPSAWGSREFACINWRRVLPIIGRMRATLIVYALICVALVFVFLHLPTSFLPQEDQGVAQMQFTLPPGATAERTLAAAQAVEHYFLTQEQKDVSLVYTVIGSGPAGAAQNAGRGFMSFKPWDERAGANRTAMAITRRSTKNLSGLRDLQFTIEARGDTWGWA